MSTAHQSTTAWDELDRLAAQWQRSLRSRNVSGRTEVIYLEALTQLHDFLLAEGLSTDVADITRDHMRAFLDQRLSEVKASTVSISYRAMNTFFKWCVDEDVLERSPLDNVRAPMVIVEPVPVLSTEQLRALLVACAGKEFRDVRDLALLRLFIDSGARRGEIAGLTVEDVDFNTDCVWVTGKGRRQRAAPFGDKTATALERYLRLRARHTHADLTWLWIGRFGRVTHSGLSQIVERRARLAGVEGVHCHMFRHGFADNWLRDGGSEGDLMQLLGWKSRAMVERYASSTAAERARLAYRRSPTLGDRL